jgi:hypothetical protein
VIKTAQRYGRNGDLYFGGVIPGEVRCVIIFPTVGLVEWR